MELVLTWSKLDQTTTTLPLVKTVSAGLIWKLFVKVLTRRSLVLKKRVGDRQETGINMLEAGLAPLPDKRRAAIIEHGHAGIFLIARTDDIDAKRAERARVSRIQPASANAPAIAVRGVVLPDHDAIGGSHGHVRKHLVAQKRAHDGILGALGGIVIGLGLAGEGHPRNQHPNQDCGNPAGRERTTTS